MFTISSERPGFRHILLFNMSLKFAKELQVALARSKLKDTSATLSKQAHISVVDFSLSNRSITGPDTAPLDR